MASGVQKNSDEKKLDREIDKFVEDNRETNGENLDPWQKLCFSIYSKSKRRKSK